MLRLVPVMLSCGLFLVPTSCGEKTQQKAPLRAGIIGLDTSHVIAFTAALNKPKDGKVEVQVVAGYPGGSPDIPASKNRVDNFTKQLRDKFGVEIVDSVEELLKKVDVVLLESVDGRKHLEQVRPVLLAGKPVFIDKPVAGTLAEALRIYELARKQKVPCFSSSALRFTPQVASLKNNPKVGKVLGCFAHSPCEIEPHHPDLFWYGVHGVEALYAVMGTGCKTVTRTHTKDIDVVTGVWHDGRVGTFRGDRGGKPGYGTTAFGSAGVVHTSGFGGYEPLVREIVTFFQTGRPPVGAEETIEMFTFMEAADESKRQGGTPVDLERVLEKARKTATERSGR
jgi:predicted dehydrogenase